MSVKCNSGSTCWKELCEWSLISIFLPFLAPILFFYFGLLLNIDTVPPKNFNFWNVIHELFVINGIYLFFGFLLLLDLFNEYKHASVEFSRTFYLFAFIISLGTCILFIINLNFHKNTENIPPLIEKFNYFIFIWSVIVTIYKKNKIIKQKNNT